VAALSCWKSQFSVSASLRFSTGGVRICPVFLSELALSRNKMNPHSLSHWCHPIAQVCNVTAHPLVVWDYLLVSIGFLGIYLMV
jgi:hypothetical protein